MAKTPFIFLLFMILNFTFFSCTTQLEETLINKKLEDNNGNHTTKAILPILKINFRFKKTELIDNINKNKEEIKFNVVNNKTGKISHIFLHGYSVKKKAKINNSWIDWPFECDYDVKMEIISRDQIISDVFGHKNYTEPPFNLYINSKNELIRLIRTDLDPDLDLNYICLSILNYDALDTVEELNKGDTLSYSFRLYIGDQEILNKDIYFDIEKMYYTKNGYKTNRIDFNNFREKDNLTKKTISLDPKIDSLKLKILGFSTHFTYVL